MMLRVVAVALLLVPVLVWAQTEKKTFDPSWVVPEKAVEQKSPLAGKPQAAAGGKKLFSRMCATCHGDDAHAQTHNAPNLASDIVQQETDGALFWRISTGNSRKGMPSFSSLPEMQRWQLVLYLRTLPASPRPSN